jgi:hypothetical protein
MSRIPTEFPRENPDADRLHEAMKRLEEIKLETRRHWLELEMFIVWLDWHEAREAEQKKRRRKAA